MPAKTYHFMVMGISAILLAISLSGCRCDNCSETNGACERRPQPFSLRPFYIIGHDPDDIEDVKEYLSLGANAIEPDVNIYASNPSRLCIGHGPKLGTGGSSDSAPSLEEFLGNLHKIARDHPQLALVYFDCKELVATPELGKAILNAVRTNLIGTGEDKVDLNIIVSVASLKEGAIFDKLIGNLH